MQNKAAQRQCGSLAGAPPAALSMNSPCHSVATRPTKTGEEAASASSPGPPPGTATARRAESSWRVRDCSPLSWESQQKAAMRGQLVAGCLLEAIWRKKLPVLEQKAFPFERSFMNHPSFRGQKIAQPNQEDNFMMKQARKEKMKLHIWCFLRFWKTSRNHFQGKWILSINY